MDNDVKQIIEQALRDRTKVLKRKIEAEYNPLIRSIYQEEYLKINGININEYQKKKPA